jgi:hypothetical protein
MKKKNVEVENIEGETSKTHRNSRLGEFEKMHPAQIE